jgi:hypothetical protein
MKFSLYIYNLNDMIVINFILGSPFHIKFFNLLHEFFLAITCFEIFITWLINIYSLKHRG